MNNNKLNIKEFDLSKITNPPIVIIAKRKSGKSLICRDILNNLKNKNKYDIEYELRIGKNKFSK